MHYIKEKDYVKLYISDDKTPRADGRGQKRYKSFEVQWYIEGKRKTKTFSVNKYGSHEEAKKQAILFREKKLEEMKI